MLELLIVCASTVIQTPGALDAPIPLSLANESAAPVTIWVNDRLIGEIAPHTVVTKSLPRDSMLGGRGTPQERIAITAIERATGEWRLNAIVMPVAAESKVDVVWSGISVPVMEASPLAPARVDEQRDALFRLRWGKLQNQLAGVPATASDSMVQTQHDGLEVRGGVLAGITEQGHWVSNSIGMLFVKVPKATFTIGQKGGPAGRSVTLTHDYFLAVTEMTRAQWARTHSTKPDDPNEADLPVTDITWSQATSACEKLSDIPGYVYRLPTEAQWERACQAGAPQPFSPANVDPGRIMWNSSNSGGRVQPVGTRLPNELGLFDMHGNVREWCRDWWSPVPSVGTDPSGPERGSQRVRRGGAFDTPAAWCASGYRDAGRPEIAAKWLGFRMVLEPK